MLKAPVLKIIPWMLISMYAFGQEAYIFGKIKDAKTFESLVGVNVVADSAHGTVTDVEGKYRLKLPPGNYKITFSFISYETVKKNVSLKDGTFKEINLALETKSEQLDIVVVTASQYEKNIAQETVSMDVLSSELIENTNARELGEALLKTPGVQVQDAQISIRGGSSYSYGVGSRTSVLVDGLSYMSADLGDAKLKFIPLEDAEQVEVIKGASSVVYGSSALNGVVNVRTGWPKTGEKVTEVNTYFGTYAKPPREETRWTNTVRGFSGMFFNHRQRIKNLQILAGGNIDYISSYLEQADEWRVRGNFKTKYNLPNNPGISFGLNANIMKEVSQRFFISADLDSFIYQYGQGSLDDYIQTAINPHFTYRDDNGNRFTFNAQYFNVFRHGAPNYDTIANFIDSIPAIDSVAIDYGTPSASSNNFSFDAQYQKNRNDRLILTAGTPFTVGYSRSNLYEDNRVSFTGAGYAQLEFNIEDFSIVGGVRYEFSSVDSVFETSLPVFRFGVNYKAANATFLRASWGQAYRLPSVGERFIAQEFTSGIYIVPNPELVVEKGWSMELGVKQGLVIRKWKGYFDFSCFWMEYDEFVEYRFGTYPNYWPGTNEKIFPQEGPIIFIGIKPNNVDQARIFGWEASIAGKGKIGPVEISTLAGYTYFYPANLAGTEDLGNIGDSTQQNIGTFLKNSFKYFAKRLEGEETNKLLQFRQRHLLRGDIELTYKKFSLGYSLQYNSFFERIPNEFIAAVNVIETNNTSHSPPYSLEKYIKDHSNGDWVMDARLGYDIKENVRLGFLVKNFTNLEYAFRPGKADAPMNFTATCRVRF